MAPSLPPLPKNATSVRLAQRPKDHIDPKTTFTTKTEPTPSASDLKDGQVIFQAYYLSLDPAMRGWMNDTRSYLPPVGIGEVMRGEAVGVVRASRSKLWKEGDWAVAMCGWAEVAIVHEKGLQSIAGAQKMTDALGVVGMTGLTAYFGILEIGDPKPGDLVVVSGAAGAVGSVVVQIAKIKGAKVVAIAGTEDKCKWLTEELGADVALNYKAADFGKKFREATKSLIDVYFDNVGGDILDMALGRAKPFSRFVMCGGISQYNASVPKGPKNYMMITSMRIKMQGYIVFDYIKQYQSARRQLGQWLSEGKIKRQETIIKGGLAQAPEALRNLYEGINTGKLLVEVTPQDGQVKSKL